MTNEELEERAESITIKVLGGNHAQLEGEITKAFTQVRNEALEEAVNKIYDRQVNRTNGYNKNYDDGYNHACTVNIRTIEALKDGDA